MKEIEKAIIDQQIADRKANYWRGFRACLLLIVAPGTIAFIIFCYKLIAITQ